MVTFCLLHGAWHDGSCWEGLVERLLAAGHDALAPDLPYEDRSAGFQERIRPAVEALQAVSGPTVVVGHSLGSDYAALVAARRPGSLLVHLCPRLGQFSPRLGAPRTFRKDFPFPPTDSDGATVWDAQAAIDAMYPRLTAEIASALADRLRPLTQPSGEYPLPRHPDVATALVYAANDEIFEPAWQRFMAHEMLGVEPIELPGGHFPMLEDPASVADLLDRLALEHLTTLANCPSNSSAGRSVGSG